MADISRQPGGSKKMNAISYYADYSCMLILIGYTIQHGTGLEYLDAGVKLPSGMDLNTLVISSSKDGETERLKITFPIPPFAVISNLPSLSLAHNLHHVLSAIVKLLQNS